MWRRGEDTEYNRNSQKDNGLICPTDKSIEMSPHPCTDGEKEEEAPQDNTQETKNTDHRGLDANGR
jgi:hypothetical protein